MIYKYFLKNVRHRFLNSFLKNSRSPNAESFLRVLRICLLGLVSGLPADLDIEFNIFPSEVISPRAFQMKQGDDSWDLLRATDAAVVRTQIDGEVLQAEMDNKPFQVYLSPGISGPLLF